METLEKADLMERLAEWLQDHGLSFHDIHFDDDGIAYIVNGEDFTDSEGGEFNFKRVDVPTQLQAVCE